MNYITCRTPYHLLLASLLIINGSIIGGSIIFYSASINDESQRKLVQYLINNKIIEDAIGFDDHVIYDKIRKNAFGIFVSKRLIKALPMPADKSSRNTYYFFLAGIFEINLFKNDNLAKFILLEDGEAIYTNFKKYYYKEIVKKIFGLGTHSKKFEIAQEIWCQYPHRLPIENARRIPNKKLSPFQINKETKDFILSAYEIPFDQERGGKAAKLQKSLLILTQPWSEDGVISEQKKIEFYIDIVQNHGCNSKIFIKPHPRETTDYKMKFIDATIFPRNFPIEILNYTDMHFDMAVTINSSALGNIGCASEKIHLGFDSFPDLISNNVARITLSP